MDWARHRRWLLPLAKLAVVLLLAWALRASLVKGLADLRQHTWQAQPQWLLLAGVLYLLAMLPSALFWRSLLQATRQPAGRAATLRAFYVSQLGKYVPGKAMVLVLRAGLLGRGIEVTVVAASVFVETLATMAVGALWALAILLVGYPERTMLIAAAAAMLVATAVPTWPRVMQWLLGLIGTRRFNPQAAERMGAIGARVLVMGYAGLAGGWVLYGASLGAVLQALGASGNDPAADWALHVAVAALSVVSGFLALVPGGLGVRELVLLELLRPRYGETLAIVSAIVLRLVWLVAEVVISAILYVAVRPAPADPPAAEPPG